MQQTKISALSKREMNLLKTSNRSRDDRYYLERLLQQTSESSKPAHCRIGDREVSKRPSRWNNYLPVASSAPDCNKYAFVDSQYTSLARILDMNYTKVHQVTEIHVKNLTVDLHL